MLSCFRLLLWKIVTAELATNRIGLREPGLCNQNDMCPKLREIARTLFTVVRVTATQGFKECIYELTVIRSNNLISLGDLFTNNFTSSVSKIGPE